MNENSTGKSFFIIAALVAVIALILSVSRLFLSSSDRTAVEGFWMYDITQSSQMVAFLSIIIISIPLIMIGSFIRKNYDIIGVPLMMGGLLTMIFETAVVFGVFYLSSHYQQDTLVAEVVLTLVLAAEWLMLVVYLWQSEDKLMATPVATPHTPNPNPPTPDSEIDISASLPPSVVNN